MQELGFDLAESKVRQVAHELATSVGRVRWNDNLRRDCLPNSLVKLSVKEWINSELFLEWFTFSISEIPPARIVILIMDSHASHINPAVISITNENSILLFTFPAHTTDLLQEALQPSQLTNRPLNEECHEGSLALKVDSILTFPSVPLTPRNTATKRKTNSRAKCLTPTEEIASTSATSVPEHPTLGPETSTPVRKNAAGT
ncbi:hypothetical protein PR048_027920 [Dryococelus australis]|uniref:DDE-1 domain-containing protein n=1 Tax=Dryococelus australis TaxID=614101 RepID=A0ABQ9GHW6_9NEOP|nr:hypothetical protein PR048_027920 [Dryococelus australis]